MKVLILRVFEGLQAEVIDNEEVKSAVDSYCFWRLRARDRGRNADYSAPHTQIPACTANALGSCLG